MATTFSATAQWLGVPDFKIVDIQPEKIAAALQVYLERGSKLTGVSLDDINTNVAIAVPNSATANLAGLLSAGMKLFDALVWLQAGRPATHPLSVDSTMTKESIPSLHDVSRSLFYCYFFILTQARYPARSTATDQPKVANFLTAIMGMTGPQGTYVEKICSFEPEKFDKQWVKYVQFAGLGQEVVSRFGLGLAGYRLFGPFKLYTPDKPHSPEIAEAVSFARNIATSLPTWDIHPATRNPEVLTKRGNLNKNLANLILDVYTDATIQEMVDTKVLYKFPVREASARNYLSWSAADDISGSTPIFRTT
jgi:hypothetical protein